MIHKNASGQYRISALVALLGTTVLLVSGLARAAIEDDIRLRLQGPGQVCVMGEECAAGMAAAAGGGNGEPKDPEQVYQTYCFACHGTGANESPVLGEASDWEDRVAKGVDELYANAINGFNNGLMPARGLCMDCSDEDIQATVDYMLDALD